MTVMFHKYWPEYGKFVFDTEWSEMEDVGLVLHNFFHCLLCSMLCVLCTNCAKWMPIGVWQLFVSLYATEILNQLSFRVEWNRVHYYWGHYCPIVPAPDDNGCWCVSSIQWNDWQGKPKYSEKIYPIAALSTTNPTWPDPGSNPGCRRRLTALAMARPTKWTCVRLEASMVNMR
jgi:hypothetical protein